MKMTVDEFDAIYMEVVNALLDKNHFGGPWFNTKEECEDWMGDIFGEALEIALKHLGYEIDWE